MKSPSKFLLSLLTQSALLFLTLCLLDKGQSAIVMASFCTVWNLFLTIDWALYKSRRIQRDALMHTLPASVLHLLPLLFFAIAISVSW